MEMSLNNFCNMFIKNRERQGDSRKAPQTDESPAMSTSFILNNAKHGKMRANQSGAG